MIPRIDLLKGAGAVGIKGRINFAFLKGFKPFFKLKAFIPAIKMTALVKGGFYDLSYSAVSSRKYTL